MLAVDLDQVIEGMCQQRQRSSPGQQALGFQLLQSLQILLEILSPVCVVADIAPF